MLKLTIVANICARAEKIGCVKAELPKLIKSRQRASSKNSALTC